MSDYKTVIPGGWNEFMQIDVTFEPIKTSNFTEVYYGNAMLFQNKGTNTIVFNNGWTLGPDEAIGFRTGEDKNIVSLRLSGIFVGVGTNRLEIITSQPEGKIYDNYSPR